MLVLYRLDGIGNPPDTYTALNLIVLSIFLATLSYFIIEAPFRRINITPFRAVISGLCVTATVSATAYSVKASEGFSSRLPEEARYFLTFDAPGRAAVPDCFLGSRGDPEAIDLDACASIFPGKPNVLVIGESFANHYLDALRDEFPDVNIASVIVTGCRPTIPPTGPERCATVLTRLVNQVLPTKEFDVIILSARWSAAVVERLPKTIDRLSDFVDQVIIFGPSMEYNYSVPKLLAKSSLSNDDGLLIRKSRRWSRISRAEQAAKEIVLNSGAVYFSPFDILCQGGNDCAVVTPDGTPMHRDYGHFTYEGSLYVVGQFKKAGFLRHLHPGSDPIDPRPADYLPLEQ